MSDREQFERANAVSETSKGYNRPPTGEPLSFDDWNAGYECGLKDAAEAAAVAQEKGQRVPMSDIQILGGLMDKGAPDKFFDCFRSGVRFAEQAHGIGGGT